MAVRMDDKDVVVIGAGLSGLVAARRIEARGARVAVVEARDRVGGKLASVEVGDVMVDLGASWVAPGERRVIELAAALGITATPAPNAGRVIHYFGGRRHTARVHRPQLASLASRLESALLGRRFERLRKQIPREHPWFAPDAQRLDSMTLEDFKRRSVLTAGARGYVDFLSRLLLFAEPREVSLLFFLSRLQACGGAEALVDSALGWDRLRFPGGAQRLCERLQQQLEGEVLLAEPALALEQDEEGVSVRTEARTLRARYAVVALTPVLAGRLRYSPPLPAERDALSQRMPIGAGTKAIAVFERPWWREQGLAGVALADRGLVHCVFDASPADGSRGVLAALVTAQAAREVGPMSPAARRRAILAAIAPLFGLNELVPLAYTDHSWDIDPWSRGAGAGHMGPGTMTAVGSAIRGPAGRIHWAGSAAAREWCGHMEGAAEAGERAAAEVLARIGEHRRRLAAGA